MDVTYLNQKYKIEDKIEFMLGRGGLPVAIIKNDFGKVELSLYGAQVLSYQPKGQLEVLWLSERSFFEEGKAIRGGIPVCFPWFGPHISDSQKPMHGFARLKLWEIVETSELIDGSLQIKLKFQDDETTRALWQFSFLAELTVTLRQSLKVQLSCNNTGTEQITYTDALHSYFNVGDIEKIKIFGLKNARYYDGIEGKALINQNEDVLRITKEENRRYVDTTSECIIEDPVFCRKIRVGKRGSKTTIVWNPWIETTKKLSDMPEDGYKKMVCIEAANAYADVVTLHPETYFVLETEIAIETIK